jgi:hypothetical protein
MHYITNLTEIRFIHTESRETEITCGDQTLPVKSFMLLKRHNWNAGEMHGVNLEIRT